MIVVKHHSGKSVYAWRVYRLIDANGNGSRIIRCQLAKYRTQEGAERAAKAYRDGEERLKAAWAKVGGRLVT